MILPDNGLMCSRWIRAPDGPMQQCRSDDGRAALLVSYSGQREFMLMVILHTGHCPVPAGESLADHGPSSLLGECRG